MSKTAVTTIEDGPVAPIATSSSDGSALIAMIERAARDPNVDIDKMERLFAMHERVEARRAEQEYNDALAAAQAEIKPVARKLRNTQTNSNYADLAAISDAADPIIHKHGLAFVVSQYQSATPDCMGIRAKVSKGSHSEIYDFDVPLDSAGIKGNTNKTATHAFGSTLTYGRRYAKCAVLDISTKNDTDGNQPSETITPAQAEELAKLITDTKSDIVEFLAIGKIESLSDMPAREFSGAVHMLKKRRLNMEAAAKRQSREGGENG